MSILDDEFDLDLRLSVGQGVQSPSVGGFPGIQAQETEAPEQTCPVDTCSLGCQTMSPSCGQTCGCDTSLTCDHRFEPCGDAITFGPYCEDQSGGEDTCHACPPPGTQLCPDE